MVANIYGWTGGRENTPEAARTDDMVAVCLLQFQSMPDGPKAICGDFNGAIDSFPIVKDMLENGGWTDIGNDERACHGSLAQNTCHVQMSVNVSHEHVRYKCET